MVSVVLPLPAAPYTITIPAAGMNASPSAPDTLSAPGSSTAMSFQRHEIAIARRVVGRHRQFTPRLVDFEQVASSHAAATHR